MSGFIEVVLRHRRRGRPTARRTIRVELRDGTRLSIADGVPPALVREVLRAVLRLRGSRC